MTREALLPLHAESASKSRVLLSAEPSTGQNIPQNFCLGLLAGLSEPMLWKKAGTSPAVDMAVRMLGVSQLLQLFLFLLSAPRAWTATAFTGFQEQVVAL